jgi:hypothetical protein
VGTAVVEDQVQLDGASFIYISLIGAMAGAAGAGATTFREFFKTAVAWGLEQGLAAAEGSRIATFLSLVNSLGSSFAVNTLLGATDWAFTKYGAVDPDNTARLDDSFEDSISHLPDDLKDQARKEELRYRNLKQLGNDVSQVSPPTIPPTPRAVTPTSVLSVGYYLWKMVRLLIPFIHAAERAEQYNTSKPAPPVLDAPDAGTP